MKDNSKTVLLKGIIMGMKDMGATYHKCDGMDMFFIIDKDSEFSKDKDKLRISRDLIMKEFGLTLKIHFKK